MWRTGVVLAATLIWVATAYGEEPNAACAGDVERFCADVTPGGGRLMLCLRQHAKELSPPCKDAFAARAHSEAGTQSRARRWFRICKPEIATYCKNVPAGAGRIAHCLERHKAQLSPGCQSALDARRARATAQRTAARPTAAAPVTPRPTP